MIRIKGIRASSKKREKQKPIPSASTRVEELVASAMAEYVSPALEDLLPDLSREEQLRLQAQFRDRIGKKYNKKQQRSPPRHSEWERDMPMVLQAQDALRHYNAAHPGGEFDLVKPLMKASVCFNGQTWYHLNFWPRSRNNTRIIKRFFAEAHQKMLSLTLSSFVTSSSSAPTPSIPVVEICTIIEEPLSQYKRSCAFCAGHLDILHPKGCRKFVCGNDKDRFYQRLEHHGCRAGPMIADGVVPYTGRGMPFTGRPAASIKSQKSSNGSIHQEEEDEQD